MRGTNNMNVPMALLRSFPWPQGVITTRSGTEYWFSREPKVNFTDPGIPAGRTEDEAAFDLGTTARHIFQIHAGQIVIALHQSVAAVGAFENKRHHVYVASRHEADEIIHRDQRDCFVSVDAGWQFRP